LNGGRGHARNESSVSRWHEDFKRFNVGEILWDGEKILVAPVGIKDFQEMASRPY
jgi:hypothetical protein